MRFLSFALLTSVPMLPLSAGEPTLTRSGKAVPIDWREDRVCRLVFHAVFEGLYEDGVPDSVVDAVVPREPKPGELPVKKSFVIQCPLCHPVYEAFVVYQKRPAFAGNPGHSTFGKGLDADTVKGLTSDITQLRLETLAPLVKKWVQKRLTSMRLSEVENEEWMAKLVERSRQGKASLNELMKTDPSYKGWSMYWGCAACNGTTQACQAVK